MRTRWPLLLLLLLPLGWWGWQRFRPIQVDKRHAAIWMAHRWFSKSPGAEEIRSTAQKLRQFGFTDLYFHTGPLDGKGHIPAWKAEAWKPVLQQFRQELPGLRAYAWVGGLTVEGYGVAPDTVNLADPAVRTAIVQTCHELVQKGGFDGIHYDLEHIPSGHGPFIQLLRETSRPLSVAFPAGWKPAYLREVAENCDQVALMSYDCGRPSPAEYSDLISKLVPALCKILAPTRCRAIIGVPAYPADAGTPAHDALVENPTTALKGILQGLRDSPDTHSFQGIGLYAQWTAGDADWQAIRESWDP